MTTLRKRDDLFWVKVQGASIDTCWTWKAALRNGYGVFYTGNVANLPKFIMAHRYAWLRLRGDIPRGLQLDHLCRNRACVNPWHLEPVTLQVNIGRGAWAMTERCPRGHPYDASNTRTRAQRNGRECRACALEYQVARRQERKALLEADPTVVQHGRLGTYNDWCCRCPLCRDAATEYARMRRERRARVAA